MADGRQRAVFLDRDGTIVDDPGFLHEPEKVKLLPGAADGIRRLNDAGYRVIVVTNQSGIEPGLKLFREAQAAFDIDFSRSWWIGDRLSDVQPARLLGGNAILVATGDGNLHQGQARALGVMVVADLGEAVQHILSV